MRERKEKDKRKKKHFFNYRFNRQRTEDLPVCPLCKKPIRDLYSAVTYPATNSPAHFDCVLKELKETNELGPNEKICYLGNGSFGIVQFRGPESPIKFFIRKRIQYEEKDKKPEWREKLPIRVVT